MSKEKVEKSPADAAECGRESISRAFATWPISILLSSMQDEGGCIKGIKGISYGNIKRGIENINKEKKSLVC